MEQSLEEGSDAKSNDSKPGQMVVLLCQWRFDSHLLEAILTIVGGVDCTTNLYIGSLILTGLDRLYGVLEIGCSIRKDLFAGQQAVPHAGFHWFCLQELLHFRFGMGHVSIGKLHCDDCQSSDVGVMALGNRRKGFHAQSVVQFWILIFAALAGLENYIGVGGGRHGRIGLVEEEEAEEEEEGGGEWHHGSNGEWSGGSFLPLFTLFIAMMYIFFVRIHRLTILGCSR